jgi:hypothetical protein
MLAITEFEPRKKRQGCFAENSSKPKGERSAQDFYPTPPECTIVLARYLGISKDDTVLEPACGELDIVRVLRQVGATVLYSDLSRGTNFLTGDFPEVDWIITNPPYSQPKGISFAFIKKALTLKPRKGIAMLMKGKYWATIGRAPFFKLHPATHILHLAWTVNFDWKKSGFDKKGKPYNGATKGGSMDISWNVWRTDTTTTTATYEPLEYPWPTLEQVKATRAAQAWMRE